MSEGKRNQEIVVFTVHKTKRKGPIWPRAARAIVEVSLAAVLACCAATLAMAAEDLYRAQTVRHRPGRGKPFDRLCLRGMEDVLIKVSGAVKRLAGDRRLAAYKSKAEDFVKAFDYHDQIFR